QADCGAALPLPLLRAAGRRRPPRWRLGEPAQSAGRTRVHGFNTFRGDNRTYAAILPVPDHDPVPTVDVDEVAGRYREYVTSEAHEHYSLACDTDDESPALERRDPRPEPARRLLSALRVSRCTRGRATRRPRVARVVVCGLGVVVRLENQPRRRRLAVRARCSFRRGQGPPGCRLRV